MKILLRILLIAAVIGSLALGLNVIVAKKQRVQTAFASAERPLPKVEAEPVKREQWQRYLFAVGLFTAVQDVNVTNEIEGKVISIHFDSGQAVEQGDILVTLDSSVDVAELDALKAEQRLNELQFERSKKLMADNTISKSEFDIAAARRDEAIAMTRAKAAGLHKKTIRAPFSGVLGIRRIDLGEYLDAGSNIVSLQSLSPIYLDFATPERFIGMVSLGQVVETEVHAYPKESFRGTIEAVEPGIDVATRNMRIRATFANAERRLRPGMFAEIRSTVPQSDDVLTVPETAVTYSPYGNSVFVVANKDGKSVVERRQVETSEVRGGRVRVTRGLKEDETIVSAGHNKLRNGMAIVVSAPKQLTAEQRAQ